MPWWSWILIWGALVIGALALVAWLAFRLFRKLMAAFEALGDLSDQVAELGANVETLAPEHRVPAIFSDRTTLHQERQSSLAERANARQARRDRLIRQGKLLQRAPLSQRTPPHA